MHLVTHQVVLVVVVVEKEDQELVARDLEVPRSRRGEHHGDAPLKQDRSAHAVAAAVVEATTRC